MAKENKLSFVERLVMQATGNGQTIGHHDDPARAKWPLLWEWLSTLYVGAERVKSAPTISLNLTPSGVVVRVTDRDLARSVEVSCNNLEEVFATLEANLSSANPSMKIIGKREPRLRKRQKSD